MKIRHISSNICRKGNHDRIYYKSISVMLVILLVSFHLSAVIAVEAAAATDIRIGLKGLYGNVNSIRIENTMIGMGYCIDDKYSAQTEFRSSNGFTFKPATGGYYSLNTTYQSYAAALRVSETLKGLGVSAYPATIYQNYWKVYVGGVESSKLKDVYEKIKGRFGFSYTALSSDNGQRVLVSGSFGSFLIDAEKKQAYPQFKALTSDKNGVSALNLGTRKYRGRIEIGRYGKKSVTAVNIIQVEAYLYGVVPSEMPSSWPAEALKVQAVCARSFVLSKAAFTADSNLSKPFQVDDTTSNQAYKGYGAETREAKNAVNATRNQVIKYKGKIITAFFFSTSGGSTENSEDVWGNSVPYLRRVPDSFEYAPEKQPWIVSYTKNELSSRLSKYRLGVGTIKKVYSAITTASGRVYSLRILGSSGTSELQAEASRDILDLYSTKYKVVSYGETPDKAAVLSSSGKGEVVIHNSYLLSASGTAKAPEIDQYIVQGRQNMMNYPSYAPKDKNTFLFAGMGYGHGVGLSQSGAAGMARNGYSYKKILEYYYTGCSVSSISR